MSRLLIMGGTGFIGPHIARHALEAGHAVTLFHRGDHPRPPGLEAASEVLGDRLVADDLRRLAADRWDAVIDTSCYFPRAARLAVDALEDHVDRYVLVSSVSVYADGAPPYATETAPLAQLPDESVEAVTGETYGGLKVLCEVEVMGRLAGRAIIIRPGILVGPGDPTERFTYWVRRMTRGGVVLAPGPEDLEVQYLDARDLAVWTVSMAAGGVIGVYNAAGPRGPMTMRGLLEGIRENAGGDATLRWAPANFLLDEGVAPWSDMPLWLPASEGSITADNSRAVAAGLAFRPLEETVADTVRWARHQPPPGEGPPGLPPTREADLIAKLRGD